MFLGIWAKRSRTGRLTVLRWPCRVAVGATAGLVTALLAGCGTVVSTTQQTKLSSTLMVSPSPTPQQQDNAAVRTPTLAVSSQLNPVIYDPAVITQQGYQAEGKPAFAPEAKGQWLFAWLGQCEGSRDGHCLKIFFFSNTVFLGTDTWFPSQGIVKYYADGHGTIAVTYANYAPDDPVCCPSLSPVTITYHWTGSQMVPSGTPPDH